uniref:tandem-95 repeat protein n=3 Tax=Vibrio harveyi group TaxID=717610 RepID=UPI002160D824|nr:Ig-like domain-containing protein [Vibrio alginolyticus]
MQNREISKLKITPTFNRKLALMMALIVTSHQASANCGGSPPAAAPVPSLSNTSSSINEDGATTMNPGLSSSISITGRRINSGPAHGTARWSGNNVYYKPAANWCGRDTFTYSASNSSGWSATRTATINVACVVDAPVLGNSNTNITEDTNGTLSPGMNLDGGTISGRYVTTQPAHGSVSWSGNKLVYTPTNNYCGSDTFQYRIKTQGGYSNIATGTVGIACVVDLPIIGNVSGTLDEDTNKSLSPSINIDGGTITKRIIKSLPAHGTAVWNGNNLVYTPDANYCGADTFTYQVATEAGNSNVGTANLNVTCIVDPPIVSDVFIETLEDNSKSATPTVNLDGGNLVSRDIEVAPANGTVIWQGASLLYTPNPDYCGNDEFQYSVTNSAGKSELAKGDVFVECVVDAPILDGVTETVIEDTPKLLSPNYNIDGGVISKYDIVSDPANGTAEWVDGNILYSPAENYCGFDTFTYQITTEGGKSNIATSNINVECVQDAPTVDGQEEIKITVETTKDYTYLANDVDGDTLTATMTELNKSSLPEWAKFAFDGSKGTLTLSPSDTDMGDYTLELLVDDGHSGMAMKRIAVYVRDDRPVTLTSILLKTFSIPQEFETPAGKKMNAVYFTGIKDSLGNLITGTYDLTITMDSSVTFPVTILGQRIEPGVPTVISYDIPSPGVVDVKAIPVVAGEDGVVNFQISFDVK